MAEKLKKLTGRVQSVEGVKGIEGLNYEDLCIQPDVELSEGYKPPNLKSQKLRHYFCAYTIYLILIMDPLKYNFQKPMPMGNLAKWQMLLKVSFVGEDIIKIYDGWRMFFNGVANFKGVGTGAVLVPETGQHYLVSAKLIFPCTNNMAEYEACILELMLAIDMNIQELLVIGDSDLLIHQVLGELATKNTKILRYFHYVQELMKRFTKIEFKHVRRIQEELADILATLSSMIQHPDKNFIYPIR
ncbi:uncharacterized protein [Nicotiana sylvestris]|uniref:uncharacterized protein n=1 Tax=Nicotiana sylvestris TaxID=4096 RepID=UPI00388C829F